RAWVDFAARFFFFQAEDGIRDFHVTGVQTCALPIFEIEGLPELVDPVMIAAFEGWNDAAEAATGVITHLEAEWKATPLVELDPRSEERRVGKECRYRWATYE